MRGAGAQAAWRLAHGCLDGWSEKPAARLGDVGQAACWAVCWGRPALLLSGSFAEAPRAPHPMGCELLGLGLSLREANVRQ